MFYIVIPILVVVWAAILMEAVEMVQECRQGPVGRQQRRK